MKKLFSLLLTLVLLCSAMFSGNAQATAAEDMFRGLWKELCIAKDAPLVSAVLEMEDAAAQDLQFIFCRGDESLAGQSLQSGVILSDGTEVTGIPYLAMAQALLSELGLDMLPDLTQAEAELLWELFTQIILGISTEAFSMNQETSVDGSSTNVQIHIHAARLLEDISRLTIDALNGHSAEIDGLLLRHEQWIRRVFGLDSAQVQTSREASADRTALPDGTVLPEVQITEINTAYLIRHLQDLNLPEILDEDISIDIQLTHSGDISRDWQLSFSAADAQIQLDFSQGHLSFSAALPDGETLIFDTRDLEKLMGLLSGVPDYITSDAFEFSITYPDAAPLAAYEQGAQAASASCTQVYPAVHLRLDSEKLVRCLADGLIHSLQRNRQDFAQLIDKYRPWLKLWDENLASLVSPELLIVSLNQLRRMTNHSYYQAVYTDSIQISLDINDPSGEAYSASNAFVLNAVIFGWKADVRLSPTVSSILIRDSRSRNIFSLNGKHGQNSGMLEICLPYSRPVNLQYARTGSDEISFWIDGSRGEHARFVISSGKAELEYNDGYDHYTGSAEWTDENLRAELRTDEDILFELDGGICEGVLTIDAATAEKSEILRLVCDDAGLFARYDDAYSYAQLDMVLHEESCDITLNLDGSSYSAAIGRINGMDSLHLSTPMRDYSFSKNQLHDGYEYSAEILSPVLRFDACLSLRENALGLDWNWFAPSVSSSLGFELKLNPHDGLPGLFARLDFDGAQWTFEYTPGRLALENRYVMLILEDASPAYVPNHSEITITGYDIRNSSADSSDMPLYTYHLAFENEEQSYSFTLSDRSDKLGKLSINFAPEAGDILPQEINWISARDLADGFLMLQ